MAEDPHRAGGHDGRCDGAQIGPHIGQGVDLEGQETALGVERQARPIDPPAAMGVADKGLVAAADPRDWPAKGAGRE